MPPSVAPQFGPPAWLPSMAVCRSESCRKLCLPSVAPQALPPSVAPQRGCPAWLPRVAAQHGCLPLKKLSPRVVPQRCPLRCPRRCPPTRPPAWLPSVAAQHGLSAAQKVVAQRFLPALPPSVAPRRGCWAWLPGVAACRSKRCRERCPPALPPGVAPGRGCPALLVVGARARTLARVLPVGRGAAVWAVVCLAFVFCGGDRGAGAGRAWRVAASRGAAGRRLFWARRRRVAVCGWVWVACLARVLLRGLLGLAAWLLFGTAGLVLPCPCSPRVRRGGVAMMGAGVAGDFGNQRWYPQQGAAACGFGAGDCALCAWCGCLRPALVRSPAG